MKEVDVLKKRIERIEKNIQKLMKYRGDRNTSSFEISGDKQWDLIERNLLQKGIVLEHEIAKKLNEMDIEYSPNYTFIYPSVRGKFMIDYNFSNENIFCRFPNSDEVKSRMFETDIYIDKEYKNSDENFNILVTTYYLIECKSRANPPINYLFIPHKLPLKNTSKSFFQITGSKLLSHLNLDLNSIWRTNHNIIQIRYPNLDLDEKETLTEAFWQLFKRIDYEKNNRMVFTPFNLNITDIDYFKKKVPIDFELPNSIKLFKESYRKMKESNIIDEISKEKIDLKISIYVPIIVVNGNIYSIDLESNIKVKGKFSNCVNKEPGFIKRYSYLEMPPNDGEKYIEFTQFLMDFLKEEDIVITDRNFFPTNFEPTLDVLVISSSNFSEIFLSIKEHVESLVQKKVEDLASNLFLKRKEEIIRFLIFDWFLLNKPEFLDDFLSQTYKRYKEFREKNWRLRFDF